MRMLDKSRVNKERARRLCAAFISHQMGVTIATQYKKTPEDVGDLWYLLPFDRLGLLLAGEGDYIVFGVDYECCHLAWLSFPLLRSWHSSLRSPRYASRICQDCFGKPLF